ncbi:MAG: tetratricopeptide repeat protein [Nitrospirae bacterium]|nr:tetratricopeptide repeat protein [Nitrospirota bacterium]
MSRPRSGAMINRRRNGRRSRVSLGIVLGAVLLFLASGCEQIPKTMIATAEARWQRGDYLGAVQEYERLIDDYPKSVLADDAYYAIGTINYLYLDNYPKAVEAFRKVVADHPASLLALEARRTLAEIYEKKYQDHRKAVAEYQQLLERTPDRAVAEEVQYRIGEVYFDQGDFDQARIEWDQLLKQAPQSRWADNALYRTGTTYFLQGQYREALTVYQDALKRYPDSDVQVELRFWVANCLEELDRLDEALEQYRSLQAIYPNPSVIAVKIRNAEERLRTAALRQTVPLASPAGRE